MVSEDLTRKLREVITEQSSVAISNYFADNAMLAYEDDAPVPTLDNRAIEAYKGCKQELCRFMSNILMADMLANNLGYAECVLFLPDGDMTINVGVKSEVECSNSVEQELVRTKIGIFDTFTWQISYIGCCEDSSEIFNMNTILQNLLNEHKSQMKVIECACTSFYMKNA